VLTDPTDLTAGPKGYVKCNIIVNAKGERVKVHPETEGEEDIEGYSSLLVFAPINMILTYLY